MAKLRVSFIQFRGFVSETEEAKPTIGLDLLSHDFRLQTAQEPHVQMFFLKNRFCSCLNFVCSNKKPAVEMSRASYFCGYCSVGEA